MTIEELNDLYVVQGKSIRQIADMFGVNKGVINRLLTECNILKRNKSESVGKRFATTPRKKEDKVRQTKGKAPILTYNLTDDNWEIKETNLRADRQNVKCLYVDGVRVPSNHKVFFICQKTGKETTKAINNFLQKPGLFSFEANQSFLHKGKKLSKEQVEGIRARNSGEKIAEYFDFTCPVCLDTFKYRDIQRNRKKKYCSKDCQKTIWVTAPEFKGEMNDLEKYFCTILDEMGYEYEPQYLVKYFYVDFFFKDKNFIIQVDGDYWHVNPEKYPEGATGKRQIQNIKVDKQFAEYIEKYTNYSFMRIWESDINNNLDKVKKAIKKALSEDRA